MPKCPKCGFKTGVDKVWGYIDRYYCSNCNIIFGYDGTFDSYYDREGNKWKKEASSE